MIVCLLTDIFNLEGNQTIVNVDVASGLHNLGDVLVVEPQNFLITSIHVLIIKCELDGFTLPELNLSSATLNKTRERKSAASKPSYNWPHLEPELISNFARTHALDKSGSDFWSLGVQSNGHWSVFSRSRSKALSCITDILDGLGMILYVG